MPFTPLWSQSTEARLGGLALAREAGLILAWDIGQRLYLWDARGKQVAVHTHLQPITAATISDDGNHLAVVGPNGRLWWFNGRLELQFDLEVAREPASIALEAFGQYVAVSDLRRQTYLLTWGGEPVAALETPRPLQYLTFVPELAVVLGAADFGFLGSIDRAGQLVWRDAPPSNIGSLTADGRGQHILVACYSNGLRHYDSAGRHLAPIPTAEPVRAACLNYAGSHILLATEGASLALLQIDGRVLGSLALPQTPAALALGALGDLGIVGLGSGTVTALQIQV